MFRGFFSFCQSQKEVNITKQSTTPGFRFTDEEMDSIRIKDRRTWKRYSNDTGGGRLAGVLWEGFPGDRQLSAGVQRQAKGIDSIIHYNISPNSAAALRKIDGRAEAKLIQIACGPAPEGHRPFQPRRRAELPESWRSIIPQSMEAG